MGLNDAPTLHPDAPPPGTVLALPPSLPRVRPHRLSRWLGRTILRLGGWRMVGAFPDLPRAVLIGAPHSSNWDGLWGFAVKMAMGLDIRVLGKDSLFRVPALGFVLRRLGVIPINRQAARGVVEQAAALIRSSDRMWVGLAPEGTRKRVEHWKAGFWKIARAADVPIVPIYFHYPDRVFGVGAAFHTSDDPKADMARIRDWYRPWQGKNRGTV